MENLSSDAIIMLAVGLFITGFLITRGALELMALIMVPIAVAAMLLIKATMPAGLIWLMAAGILGVACASLRNRPGVSFFAWAAGIAALMLAAKMMLPGEVLTRIALTIVFLGLLKFLLF
jgi:hypothetical protein